MNLAASFVRMAAGAVLAVACVLPAYAAEWDHVHLLVGDPVEGADWYAKVFGVEHIKSGPFEAVMLGEDLVKFRKNTPESPGSAGSAINRIGITVPDLDAAVARALKGRAQLGGIATEVKEGPKWAYFLDPWGTFIYVIEGEAVGLHHVRVMTHDVAASVKWYSEFFGGEPATLTLTGEETALRYGHVLLAFAQSEEDVAPSVGRSIDHFGFNFADFDEALKHLKEKKVTFLQEPQPADKPSMAYIVSPDGAKIETLRAAAH